MKISWGENGRALAGFGVTGKQTNRCFSWKACSLSKNQLRICVFREWWRRKDEDWSQQNKNPLVESYSAASAFQSS